MPKKCTSWIENLLRLIERLTVYILQGPGVSFLEDEKGKKKEITTREKWYIVTRNEKNDGSDRREKQWRGIRYKVKRGRQMRVRMYERKRLIRKKSENRELREERKWKKVKKTYKSKKRREEKRKGR